MSQNISPDRPGIVKRVEALENVRDRMMEFVTPTQYLHALRHAVGGDDPISAESIGAADRIHSHSYTDITDIQEMVDSFPGFDLGKLVAALVPLLKPYLSNTARKVGEYGAWKGTHYTPSQNLIRLEGLTPGKLLFVRGLANQNDMARMAGGVAAFASYYPSISGVWGGMGNKYPGLWNGQYTSNASYITRDPVNNSAAICRNSFDAKLAGEDIYNFQGYETFVMCIRDGVIPSTSGDESDGYVNGQNFFLIHSPTVRLCCTSITGDNYPVLEFWEY